MTTTRLPGAQPRAWLIPGARRAWRLLSVQIAGLGIVFEVLLQSDVLTGILPPSWVEPARYVLWGAVIVGRLVAQRVPGVADGH